MKYVKFDLETFQYQETEGVEKYSIRVIDSPVSDQEISAADSVKLPADLRMRMRLLEKRALVASELIALGEDIGNALFPPRVRQLLQANLHALSPDEGLRIRLRQATYALADIPWEFAYLPDPDTPPDQKDRRGFMAFNRRISFVRFTRKGKRIVAQTPVSQPSLRLVAFLSNPQGTAELNLDVEENNVRKALLEVPAIKPEFYRDATVETFTEVLVKKADIFHFSGHGKFETEMGQQFGSTEGSGSLSFVGENNEEVKMPADTLALNLAENGVRLAMLGACDSSKVDRVNAWSGVASALTWAGIPAVVGMQFTVRDKNAITFSKIFYRALADGQSIDEAVVAGRLAIFTSSTDDERDWGVPVLYLRTEDSVLFPKPAQATDQQQSTPVKPTTGVSTNTTGTATTTAGHASSPTPPAVVNINKKALREAIVANFTTDELEEMCSDIETQLTDENRPLQVSLDIVGGNNLRSKTLNLIEYLDNRRLLPYLVKAVREARPDLPL